MTTETPRLAMTTRARERLRIMSKRGAGWPESFARPSLTRSFLTKDHRGGIGETLIVLEDLAYQGGPASRGGVRRDPAVLQTSLDRDGDRRFVHDDWAIERFRGNVQKRAR